MSVYSLGSSVCKCTCSFKPTTSFVYGRRNNTVNLRRLLHILHSNRAASSANSRGRRSVAVQAVTIHEGSLNASGKRFAVVVARFNNLVTKLLLEGAVAGLKRHGAYESDIEVVWVPGSFELPVVAKGMAKSGRFDAIVCIGTVVRGATTHYEAVVSAATSGLLSAGTDTGVPVIFGVLTCDTMEQALDRAGGKVGNKGYEAAVTAVEMAGLMTGLREKGLSETRWGC